MTTFSHGNGNEELLLDRYALFLSSRTELPGSKLPNSWGLFDVHGNVDEWCHDWYAPYGNESALRDPMGPSLGTVRRVLRSGSFSSNQLAVRSAARTGERPDNRNFIDTGFRVTRTYP